MSLGWPPAARLDAKHHTCKHFRLWRGHVAPGLEKDVQMFVGTTLINHVLGKIFPQMDATKRHFFFKVIQNHGILDDFDVSKSTQLSSHPPSFGWEVDTETQGLEGRNEVGNPTARPSMTCGDMTPMKGTCWENIMFRYV